MRPKYLWVGLMAFILVLAGIARPLSENILQRYFDRLDGRVSVIAQELNREHFAADTTGDKYHYQRVQQLALQLTECYQSSTQYRLLCLLQKSGLIADPLLKRELELVCLDFRGNQGDKEQLRNIINQQTIIEKLYAAYRPRWRGETVSNQQLKAVLVKSTQETELASAWVSGCQIGGIAGPNLIELVKLRNDWARQQGYRDFFHMQLQMNEQNEQELDNLFRQVDQITKDEYQRRKQEMDQLLAEHYSVPPSQLKPWHYGQIFLQQTPSVMEVGLDSFYNRSDVISATTRYFTGLGLPAEEIIHSSDLKPQPGKYPYAYCMDVDRQGDVRILANLQNDADSAQTLLHEMGHAVYDRGIDPNLPWRLREPASIDFTEGVAMMFGDLYSDPIWLHNHLGVSEKECQRIADACRRSNELNQLIFCRWALVMYHFEKQLYAHPESDLDQYWWQLVERYQLITPPVEAPPYAWAAKVHLATAPVYYYHYLLGRIIACQLAAGWQAELTAPGGMAPDLGLYLQECIFMPGASRCWQELLRDVTGQALRPDILGSGRI